MEMYKTIITARKKVSSERDSNLVYEKIESPMSAFNNFMLLLSDELSEIFEEDLRANDALIFANNLILIHGKIKLKYTEDEKFAIKVEALFSDEFRYFRQIYENRGRLESIFFRYQFVLNDILKNYDITVTMKYVNSVLEDIKQNSDSFYPIPFKYKVFKNYDTSIDEKTKQIFNRFTYVLKVNQRDYDNYKYRIVRMLSSELDESKSIQNIIPLENDIIKYGIIKKNNLHEFLVKLFMYGEI